MQRIKTKLHCNLLFICYSVLLDYELLYIHVRIFEHYNKFCHILKYFTKHKNDFCDRVISYMSTFFFFFKLMSKIMFRFKSEFGLERRVQKDSSGMKK